MATDSPDRDDRADGGEAEAERARRLARAGKSAEAAGAWREAARAYATSGRPVQAVAAALEAAWLDPRSDRPVEEAAEVARSLRPPVGPGSGQRFMALLDPEPRGSLAARLHPVSYGTDQLFTREGDPADAVWFVVRGRVRATRSGPRGGPVLLGVAGAGEIVGGDDLLASGALGAPGPSPRVRRGATLVSEEPTDLLELRWSDLEALMASPHPSLRDAIESLRSIRS